MMERPASGAVDSAGPEGGREAPALGGGSGAARRFAPGVLAALFLSTPALANMDEALTTCLDTTLTIETRAQTLTQSGWTPSQDQTLAISSLAHGVLFGSLDAQAREKWADDQKWAQKVARGLRDKRGFDGVTFLTTDQATLTLEKNRSGQDTCLYTGNDADLAAVDAVIDATTPSRTGPLQHIRGEAKKAVVLAYGLDADQAGAFPEPLSFTTTFTVVLDRGGV